MRTAAYLLLLSFIGDRPPIDYRAPHAYRGTPPKQRRHDAMQGRVIGKQCRLPTFQSHRDRMAFKRDRRADEYRSRV
jgi:hypothetical protein